MKTLIFNDTMFGKIEITFDPNNGDGTVYFYQSDIEVSMSCWRFHDMYETQFALSICSIKKDAKLFTWLPKVIGEIRY